MNCHKFKKTKKQISTELSLEFDHKLDEVGYLEKIHIRNCIHYTINSWNEMQFNRTMIVSQFNHYTNSIHIHHESVLASLNPISRHEKKV